MDWLTYFPSFLYQVKETFEGCTLPHLKNSKTQYEFRIWKLWGVYCWIIIFSVPPKCSHKMVWIRACKSQSTKATFPCPHRAGLSNVSSYPRPTSPNCTSLPNISLLGLTENDRVWQWQLLYCPWAGGSLKPVRHLLNYIASLSYIMERCVCTVFVYHLQLSLHSSLKWMNEFKENMHAGVWFKQIMQQVKWRKSEKLVGLASLVVTLFHKLGLRFSRYSTRQHIVLICPIYFQAQCNCKTY